MRTGAGLREPLLAFAAATGAAALLAAVGVVVPFVRNNLHAAIALLFIYVPASAARLARPGVRLPAGGPARRSRRAEPGGAGHVRGADAARVRGRLLLFYGHVCTIPANAATRAFGGLCRHWLGPVGGHLRLPPQFLLLAFSQLVVVAIPEELFFRGYLLERLEQVWPPTRRLLGAPVGVALLVCSALFALGHVLVVPNPQRLAVFFPALVFGWMRARTGSIAAGAVFHALCNVTSDVLHTSYFG